MTLLFSILAIIMGYKVLKILLEIVYGKKDKKKSENRLFKRRF
jgi:predicted permease